MNRPGYFQEVGQQILDVDSKWEFAIDRIKEEFGIDVSISAKNKPLIIFGLNETINNSDWKTLAQFSQDILKEFPVLAGNEITHVVSNNANNDGLIRFEGHTIDGEDLTFLGDEEVQLNGQTPVALTTPMNTVVKAWSPIKELEADSKIYFLTSDQVTGGEPDTHSHVQCVIDAEFFNQSEKLESAVSSSDFYLIDQVFISMNRKAFGTADAILLIKKPGETWRPALPPISVTAGADSLSMITLEEVIVVPKNARFKIVAKGGDFVDTQVSGYVSGRLASVLP